MVFGNNNGRNETQKDLLLDTVTANQLLKEKRKLSGLIIT